ncbi:MAG: hypothetical protein M0R06_16720 [Sphaerochaeta sp.]|jgi:hypothetical protein|nr:hypothetical protein [Sphaerochaeta sp.]
MPVWGTRNLSTAASQVVVTTTGAQIVAANHNRVSLLLQHQGSSTEDPCLLKLGGIPAPTDCHYVLATGSTTDARDGSGGSLHLTKWRGSVWGIVESTKATLSVLEEVDAT